MQAPIQEIESYAGTFCENNTSPSSVKLQIKKKLKERKGPELEVDHVHVGVLVFSFILMFVL